MKFIKSILLLLILLLGSCNNSEKETNPTETTSEEAQKERIYLSKAQFEGEKMALGQLTKKRFAETVQTTGVIDVPPQSRALISAFSGGYIKDTPLLVGDQVRKGQRLVTLENPEFITMQQNYLEVVEQLSYLKAEYERQEIMLKEKITSRKSFLKAESDYKSNLARKNSLKKNLEMLNINPALVEAGTIVSQVAIYSPIDGNVTRVFVNMGIHVSPADKIMEIMNTDHLHLELKVFEKDLLHLKKGQEISFTIPEASKQEFKGEVHLVGTTIEQNRRIAMVNGHIDKNEKQNFTVGMFVDAQIITGEAEFLALPENAMVELDGKNYVLQLVDEDDKGFEFNSVEVKINENYEGFTAFETNKNLSPDARFLTKGAFILLQE